jgi:hypothetical protein
MGRLRIDDHAIEVLSGIVDPPPPPTDRVKVEGEDEGFSPHLEKTQQEIFDSNARFVLAYGEKGSGKTIACLHKVVRHCYENQNALAIILVRVRSMATKGGAWEKLVNFVLPEWKDGLGLQVSEVKLDTQHNEYMWIENSYGGWSMVVLVSAPHATQLRERIRGYEPSIAFVDELTSCDDVEYLQAIAAQVGRRLWVEGYQQYIAACNPEGPSHWVYQVWFEEAYNEETGEWDADYAKFHVKIEENKRNLRVGYVEGLEKLYKRDPVEAARMLHGEWIDRPSGDALFKDIWSVQIHVKPSPEKINERILPNPKYPIIIGADPGATHNAFIWMQNLPIGDRMKWVIFDEIVIIKRRMRYDVLMPAVVRRWATWNKIVGEQLKAVWISDSSAFNQFRPGNGSFDVLTLEREAFIECQRLNLPRVKFRQAPKFSGSVQTRVRLTMNMMAGNELVVAAACVKMRKTFELLESEPANPREPYDPDRGMTPRRSEHLHPFDAFTYPVITGSIQPQLLAPVEESTSTMFSFGN